jgi:hypothetical protein
VQSVPQIFDVVGPEGAQPIEVVQVSIPLLSPRLDERVHDLTAAPEIECVRPLRSHRRDRAAAVEDKRRLSLLEQRAHDGAHQEWDVGLAFPDAVEKAMERREERPELHRVAADDVDTDLQADAIGEGTACAKFIEELRALNRDLRLPSLQDYGVDRQQYFNAVGAMTQLALATGAPGLNPGVPSTKELIALYHAAWEDSWAT